MGEVLLFFVCTSRKAIQNFEVKVNVQKGALIFEKFLTINVLVSSMVVIW